MPLYSVQHYPYAYRIRCETAAGRFLHVWGRSIRAFAYIDGFNLYYRALRTTSNKWLDIDALLRFVYPNIQLECIRYFTARVKAANADPEQPERQGVYLRALKTLPNVKIHQGRFTRYPKWLPTVKTADDPNPEYVEVMKPEEKGSDVNLGAYLVDDAHRQRFEVAVVVTNDSDLVTPIRLVVDGLGLPVWLLNPCDQPAGGLKRAASTYRELRSSAPGKCQFAENLTDKRGGFHKPESW